MLLHRRTTKLLSGCPLYVKACTFPDNKLIKWLSEAEPCYYIGGQLNDYQVV